jgi:twitching motility protein PilT
MLTTPAIRNLIRQEKVHEIYSMLQSGGRLGMQTMSQALVSLVSKGKISAAEARARATQPDEVVALLGETAASSYVNGHAKADVRRR